CWSVIAQAVIKYQPGQRTLSITQQQPLALVTRDRRRGAAVAVSDKAGLADAQLPAAHRALQAEAGHTVYSICRLRGTAECLGYRVFGAIFQRGSQGQAGIGIQIAQRTNFTQRQPPFSEGAGLVEDHRIDVVETFEYMPASQQ